MGRDWDELMDPELSKSTETAFAEKAIEGGDNLEVHLRSEEATVRTEDGARPPTPKETEKATAKWTKGIFQFKAGGCKPDGDGEIECRFNPAENFSTIGTGIEKRTVRFEDPMVEVEDAEQTKSANAAFATEKLSGLGIVHGDDFLFCTPQTDKLVCEAVERPEGVLNLKKKLGDETFLTGKNKEVTAKTGEQRVVDDIKFPEGGEASVNRNTGVVNVKPADLA